MQFKSFMEVLKGNQHKLDKNKNGKVDAHDFKLLRKEEEEEIEESEEREARADYKATPSGRKSHKFMVFGDAEKTDKKEVKEDLDEAMINGREYASQGVMHPDHAAHAAHKVTGSSIDFYAHGSGDKVEGKVTKNDGKAVHIKDTKGTTHKFKVQRGLPKQQNEEKTPPFDGGTVTQPAKKNSDGTTQNPMSRARELAKQAMKKKMKEEFDLDMSDEQVDSILECMDEQAPVAPTLDKKYIKGTPEHKAYKATKKPINNMPTNVKEETELDENHLNDFRRFTQAAKNAKAKGDHDIAKDAEQKASKSAAHYTKVTGKKPTFNEETELDEVERKTISYSDFVSNLLEYETKDGVYKHKGTYGGSYNDPEGADDADDKKPKVQPADKRGRGRPAGAKSGARKITGTSKLYK